MRRTVCRRSLPSLQFPSSHSDLHSPKQPLARRPMPGSPTFLQLAPSTSSKARAVPSWRSYSHMDNRVSHFTPIAQKNTRRCSGISIEYQVPGGNLHGCSPISLKCRSGTHRAKSECQGTMDRQGQMVGMQIAQWEFPDVYSVCLQKREEAAHDQTGTRREISKKRKRIHVVLLD